MTTPAVYHHLTWTGSGSNQATLTFSDTDAELIYSSDWMGLGHQQWTLRWQNRRVSERFGIMSLQSVTYLFNPKRRADDVLEKHGEVVCHAKNANDPDDLPIPYADFEYIILEGGEPWIADEPTLEVMASMGYAGWSSTFDLILLLHYTSQTSAEHDGGTQLDEVLPRLDGCKFISSTEPPS